MFIICDLKTKCKTDGYKNSERKIYGLSVYTRFGVFTHICYFFFSNLKITYKHTSSRINDWAIGIHVYEIISCPFYKNTDSIIKANSCGAHCTMMLALVLIDATLLHFESCYFFPSFFSYIKWIARWREHKCTRNVPSTWCWWFAFVFHRSTRKIKFVYCSVFAATETEYVN